ncbi:MAG: hypothetical protein OEV40_31460 [Acidimicrobiia bacterium]|nr:hypothetical protein [Acidimicrobiia bacterium]
MKAWPSPPVVPVFAHQGGWDELLLVVGPLALIALALFVANKRVSAQLKDSDAAPRSDIDG